MLWGPAVKFEILMFAFPAASSVLKPMEDVPSKSAMVPVGTPLKAGLTDRLKVTVSPTTSGFPDEAVVVVVGALFTSCEITEDVCA